MSVSYEMGMNDLNRKGNIVLNRNRILNHLGWIAWNWSPLCVNYLLDWSKRRWVEWWIRWAAWRGSIDGSFSLKWTCWNREVNGLSIQLAHGLFELHVKFGVWFIMAWIWAIIFLLLFVRVSGKVKYWVLNAIIYFGAGHSVMGWLKYIVFYYQFTNGPIY